MCNTYGTYYCKQLLDAAGSHLRAWLPAVLGEELRAPVLLLPGCPVTKAAGGNYRGGSTTTL